MTLPLINRGRTRITKWWKASDWSRMTGQDLAWHAAGWALCLVCVVVVGVAYACAVALWPRPMCVLTFAAILAGGWYWVGYWFGTRSISVVHDRLDYAEQHHDAVTNSPARELLAEVGPITGPTPITDVEPEPWVLAPPYAANEVSA